MKTKVNLEIYNSIELFIRATFQNTEVGISFPISCNKEPTNKKLELTLKMGQMI